MASLSEIVFACNVECALISRSLRFLFDSQPCRYSHTASRDTHLLTSIIHITTSGTTVSASRNPETSKAAAMGRAIRNATLWRDNYATESVKPDSHLQNNRRSLIMQIAITLTTSSKTDAQLSSKRQKMLTFCETASNYEH